MLINSLGFDTTFFMDCGDFYVFDTDKFITKQRLAEIRQDSTYTLPAPQFITDPNLYLNFNDVIDPATQQIHISYEVGGLNVEDSHIIEAANAWNSITDCNLDFTVNVDTSSEKEDNPYPVSLGGSYIGSGVLIRTNVAGMPNMPSNIVLDTGHEMWSNVWGQLSDDQKKYFFMHVIGHIIRLGELSSEQLIWNPNSIMKSHEDLSSDNTEIWSGLSDLDKETLQEVYPPLSDPSLIYSLNNNVEITPEKKIHIRAGVNNTLGISYSNPYYPSNSGLSFRYNILKDGEIYKTGNITSSPMNLRVDEAGAYTFLLQINSMGSLVEEFETELYVYTGTQPSITNPYEEYNPSNLYYIKFSPIENPYSAESVVVNYYFKSTTSDGTIDCLSNNEIDISFADLGAYTVVMDIYYDNCLTFFYEYNFTITEHIPEVTAQWTPTPADSEGKLLKGEKYTMVLNGVGGACSLEPTITPRVSGNTYSITQLDWKTFEITFNDSGIYDIAVKISRNEELLNTSEFSVTVVDDPTFSFAWDPVVAENDYFAVCADYTLSIDYQNEYYDNNPTCQYTVTLNEEEVTSSVVKSKTSTTAKLNFTRPGEYEIKVDVKYGDQIANSYTTTCAVVGAYFELPNMSNGVQLNTPYTFKYNYWHPEKERIYCTFEVTETAFDTTNINTIIENISENEIRVTFLDYGCYFITATATHGGVVEDQTILNITKLYQFEEHLVTLYNVTGSTLFYNLQLGTGATVPERIYCYVEQLKEERTDYFVERRIDRRFTYNPSRRIYDKGSSMPVNLPNGSITTRPLNDSVDMKIFMTYTGTVYYPANGVRRVRSTVVDSLPKTKVEIPYNDITGTFTGLDL